ncbi:pentapeptide repeat-containing protein [Pleomorphomonas sp. PLEO]|uniref:pentapeptide repeat-containing protein n=1 Tax=Pleomorphomonas sp. PLEO TaxID=3239306 RepID=UPI00351F00AF
MPLTWQWRHDGSPRSFSGTCFSGTCFSGTRFSGTRFTGTCSQAHQTDAFRCRQGGGRRGDHRGGRGSLGVVEVCQPGSAGRHSDGTGDAGRY